MNHISPVGEVYERNRIYMLHYIILQERDTDCQYDDTYSVAPIHPINKDPQQYYDRCRSGESYYY